MKTRKDKVPEYDPNPWRELQAVFAVLQQSRSEPDSYMPLICSKLNAANKRIRGPLTINLLNSGESVEDVAAKFYMTPAQVRRVKDTEQERRTDVLIAAGWLLTVFESHPMNIAILEKINADKQT